MLLVFNINIIYISTVNYQVRDIKFADITEGSSNVAYLPRKIYSHATYLLTV